MNKPMIAVKNVAVSIMLWIALIVSVSSCRKNPGWTLATDDTKLVIGVDADKKLCVFELTNPANGHNWTKSPSVFTLVERVDMDNIQYKTNWSYKSGYVENTDGTKLTILFTNDNPALELKSVWQARKGPGPIHHGMFIKNNSGKTITIYEQESIDLQVADTEKSAKVIYINDDGSIPDTIGIYHDSLTEGYKKELKISERQDWIPFVAIDAVNKYGLYIGWEWSIGRISISKENSTGAIVLKAGNSDDFKTDLYPEETFEVPPGFIGAYNGDLDDCGNSLRKYLFNYSMPDVLKTDPGYPKVEWNAFAATGKVQGSWDPVESKYYPLIDDIAPLGFEEVVIDIGWWEMIKAKAGPKPGMVANYGDPGHYVTDPVDWPSGMAAAAKYAHDRNMRFGLYDNESEFLTSDSGITERIKDITFLIKDLNADFYRSDATAGPVLKGSSGENQRAHYPEDVGYWATKGFYKVIDSMYKLIPGFLWENCSGGGRIKDYGAVRRASKIQNQDRYYPIDARRSFYDASFVFHQLQLASLVGSWADWQASGSVYEYRSASLGASYWHPDAPNGGNGGPVWSESMKNEIKRAVNTYKEKMRPLVRSANLYHILPRPDNVNWDGIEYYNPDNQTGAVMLFKPDSLPDSKTILFDGLDTKKEYGLTFTDRPEQNTTLSGEELMGKGLTVNIKGKKQSEIIFFQTVMK